jgi:hypothetical protein
LTETKGRSLFFCASIVTLWTVARLAVAGSSGTKLLDQPKWEGVQPVQQAHAKKSIPAILRRNTEAFFETKSSVRYPILARSLHRSSLQAFGTTGLKLNNSMLPGMAKNQALQSRIAAMNPSDNFGQSSDALPGASLYGTGLR